MTCAACGNAIEQDRYGGWLHFDEALGDGWGYMCPERDHQDVHVPSPLEVPSQ